MGANLITANLANFPAPLVEKHFLFFCYVDVFCCLHFYLEIEKEDERF